MLIDPIEFIFRYVYKQKSELIPFEQLTTDDIQALQMYQPRTQAEMFPEDYSDDELDNANHFYLYRGLYFSTEESYELFMEQIKQGVLVTETITSWTTSFEVANNFAVGAGYYSYQPDVERKGYRGIVLIADYVTKEQTLFSLQEAAFDIEEEFEEEINARDFTERYHEKEDEIVLLPGRYQVKIEKEIKLEKGGM